MTLLEFVNKQRLTAGLLPLLNVPSLDASGNMPRRLQHATNPIHVMIGLAMHGVIRDWFLEQRDDRGELGAELRYVLKRTGRIVTEPIPREVWHQICRLWPHAAMSILLEKQSTETSWGLDEGSTRAPKARRPSSSAPPTLRTTTHLMPLH
jgi:hypothetical protein